MHFGLNEVELEDYRLTDHLNVTRNVSRGLEVADIEAEDVDRHGRRLHVNREVEADRVVGRQLAD